jgi:hypothetical protein
MIEPTTTQLLRAIRSSKKNMTPSMELYLKHADIKDRSCLSCSTIFPSMGPGNRICTRCSLTEERGIYAQ